MALQRRGPASGDWRRGVYLGLGANLGPDPSATLAAALAALDRAVGLRVLRRSRFYRSPPWGPVQQPDYVNAVAEVATTLSTAQLMERLLDAERALGRRRDGPRYGPRTIDLDLLVDGDAIVDVPGVSVPHPRIAGRAFVLVPLAELAGELVVPGVGVVRDLLAALGPEAAQVRPLGTG